jgi:hypothetical protein
VTESVAGVDESGGNESERTPTPASQMIASAIAMQGNTSNMVNDKSRSRKNRVKRKYPEINGENIDLLL